jgi:hypothetical protein
MSKIPDQLNSLPDPAEAQPARNPFGRGRTPEKPTGPAEDSAADEQEGPSATSGTRAHRGSGKAAGGSKKAGEGTERNKRLAGSKDVLLSLPEDLAKRMESVIAYTYPHTGINQQAAFIRSAIAKSCAELEARFNDGNRWPEIPKRKAI